MAILTPIRNRFYNNDGTPASGGKVYIYEAGSSTPKNSYTDSTGSTPNTVPVILDSKGECNLWTSGLFKLNLTQSNDAQVTGYPVDNLGQGQSSYDIAGFLSNKPTASQIVLRLKMIRSINFDVNFALSRGTASVAATASTTYVIAQNGTTIGTMVFGAASIIPSFTASVATFFVAGDILSVTAPASADATLADVGFILAGYISP